ncbi:MAG: trans-2-enoyl-CoA reductase family protein [Puniceicoccales bacterium]|jgi:enoyl-[acyl-carrier protein] reductase/trans-2-enoyl-CoA reductase (NAD+)|nr:trans-2-enoyl-CoA reductase family protein [Puniceicoccales bacterium]
MIIRPKIRGFICITAHPEGCEKNILEQINYIKSQDEISDSPKKILVIGSSTGYGLASRIVASFGCKADTIGVYFERPEVDGKPASAGFYNARALDKFSQAEGRVSESINGDAFSDEIKQITIEQIQKNLGKVDCIIYSLASPRRTDPLSGETYKSVLKPIGTVFSGKTVNTDTEQVLEISIDPATEEEIEATQKVMGGEDWERWIDQLLAANVLAKNVRTYAYSYIGPEVTWPIYAHGTIGKAKDHLEQSAKVIHNKLKNLGGEAAISVNKAVVTQASSAIPVVPLYNSVLFKIMKQKEIHEGCIEQIYRLFSSHFNANRDERGRIRLDNLEMRDDVQREVKEIWSEISTENLRELSDFEGYKNEFLRLFGFGITGVDYERDIKIL